MKQLTSRVNSRRGGFMKKYTKHIISFLFVFMVLLKPLQADAKFTPQPIPAGGVTTTLSDTRYVNPDFLNRQVALTWQGNTWYMGLIVLKDTPVHITSVNGQPVCSLLDTSILKSYLGYVDVNLASLAANTSNEVIYQNEKGTSILRSGRSYMKLNEHVEGWLSGALGLLAVSENAYNIDQVLNEHFLIPVTDNASYTLSDDFIVAGTCTTSFKTSGKNRSNNVSVAASRVNNMVVMPGQSVSLSTAFLPRNAANGYLPSDVYQNGKTVTGYGGGICQVSSTTYNALMNSGVTILERKPHSMPISYLPQGLDAAISAGYKDMRFKNNYNVPIFLTAAIKNKTLTVNVMIPQYAMEGKTYKVWAKQTGELSAKTYLTTYQNGKEISTKYIGSSSYLPYKGLGED